MSGDRMAEAVIEPDYSQFVFRSKLRRSASDANATWFTEEDVQGIITSTVITLPTSYGELSQFAAPAPFLAVPLPPRPKDPMYSGKWGQPAQAQIPPEPKLKFEPIAFQLFGVSGLISQAIDNWRRRLAERSLKSGIASGGFDLNKSSFTTKLQFWNSSGTCGHSRNIKPI